MIVMLTCSQLVEVELVIFPTLTAFSGCRVLVPAASTFGSLAENEKVASSCQSARRSTALDVSECAEIIIVTVALNTSSDEGDSIICPNASGIFIAGCCCSGEQIRGFGQKGGEPRERSRTRGPDASDRPAAARDVVAVVGGAGSHRRDTGMA